MLGKLKNMPVSKWLTSALAISTATLAYMQFGSNVQLAQAQAVNPVAPPAVPLLTVAPEVVPAVVVPVQVTPAAAGRYPDFADVVAAVSPSVVNIRTMEKVRMARPGSGGGGGLDPDVLEMLRQFGFPVPNTPRQAPQQRQPLGQEQERPKGVGSGFILSADGFIMTNAHVIDGADEVLVTLTDKREFKAKVIGKDSRTDVAVVKIDAKNLPRQIAIGSVSQLRVGEWVLAIGSPFNLENTVTAGIVSAKQRDTGDFLPFIQSDVAVNPGNSGGPLINTRGEVVGINSQIYSRSGGSMGISFAIPIDEAIRISEQLRSTGKVQRGRLGVQIGPVSSELAESLGLGNKSQGAMVQSVEEGSPADKAGVVAGDIITKVNGQAIEKSVDLPRLVGSIAPGTKAALTVFRRGSVKELSITIGEMPDDKVAASKPSSETPSSKSAGNKLGLSVQEVPAEQKRLWRLSAGVSIQSATGAAARVGLQTGDVILAVNNAEVTSVKEFDSLVSRLDSAKPASLLVRRGESAQYVLIKPEK